MIPDYWKKFVDLHSLVGKEFSIPEEKDMSGLGADLEIFGEEISLEEAKNYWPGIGVYPDGFIPVAGCSIGTGDPYFINTNDGVNGPLYRIYHDRVHEKGYERSSAVALVLQNYEALIEFPILYSVWCQDGNGNNSELEKGISLEEAKARVEELRLAKGRKRYWHDQTE